MTFDYNMYQRRYAPDAGYPKHRQVPRIVCADGFSLSAQASKYHYCTPRETGESYYTHVEVGFPSAVEDVLLQYADDSTNPTETVYGWVPVEVVEAIVDEHGGVTS